MMPTFVEVLALAVGNVNLPLASVKRHGIRMRIIVIFTGP
jgi:hypothetical protein